MLLEVRNLTSRFFLDDGVVRAVEDVSFELAEGEALGIVGESGSGKTATVMSVLGLLTPPGRVVSGEVRFEGEDLLTVSDEEMRKIRGNRMTLVPQNPMASLNPVFTIEWQLREALTSHQDIPRGEVRDRIVDALRLAGIPDPGAQLNRYPHEFSGGMRQRILIAMATLNQPVLMLADEPTTALDTTMQAKVLELMAELVARSRMALLIITHNMGVVASICDRVIVMYAGRIVEAGPVGVLFRDPLHPYTRQLLLATPRLGEKRVGSAEIRESAGAGATGGCAFLSRCPLAEEQCGEMPLLQGAGPDRLVRCWVAQRDVALAASTSTSAADGGADHGRAT